MANVAVVIGAGPGLGAAVARRFAREQYTVVAVARKPATVEPLVRELVASGGTAHALAADTTDAAAVAGVFARVRESIGAPDVLVYNAGAFHMASILETPPDVFEATWRANCFGGFLCAREAAGDMVARKRGTILFTGATGSLRGGARFACLAVGKFGLRALAQSMARELGEHGVHVAHVVIDGQIESERTRTAGRPAETVLSPDAIAETYWQLHTQDRTAWTHELDLRPAVERF